METQAAAASETTLFGYGEIAYGRQTHSPTTRRPISARAVLGWSHRFDNRTRMTAELEVEHAVASADDKGEVEMEQFYAERQFTDRVGGRAGLFLIPIGFLNEHHEPTQYYGVFRNFVETSIIPTTWREGGLAVYGGTDFGLNWNVGITTGFNLANWDPSSNEGRESPLGSIHQELSLAAAQGSVGVRIGQLQRHPRIPARRHVFHRQGRARRAGFSGAECPGRIVGSPHAVAAGPVRLRRALCARDHQRHRSAESHVHRPADAGAAALLGRLCAGGVAQRLVVPGLRADAVHALRVGQHGGVVRVGAEGLGVPTAPTEGVWTIGANFFVTPNIVFKADYQQFKVDSARDSFQLGFGLNF